MLMLDKMPLIYKEITLRESIENRMERNEKIRRSRRYTQ